MNSHAHTHHGHHHAHHADHSHAHGPHGGTPISRVRGALLLIAGFMVVELAGGLLTGSLSLLADAGHMFLDASALAFAWFALHLSTRGHDSQLSYGYHRYQVLATFLNGLLLTGLVLWVVIEAFQRLAAPVPMLALPALVIAAIGLVVNLVAWRWLHGGESNAAVRSAMLHVLGDLLGSCAAIAATLTYWLTGWPYADPLLALVVAAILGRGAWTLLRDSGHILLEGVPPGIDLPRIAQVLAEAVPDVIEIHHVHAWALTAEKPLLTLHATIRPEADLERVMADIKRTLHDDFGIDHSTVQVEHGPCPDTD